MSTLGVFVIGFFCFCGGATFTLLLCACQWEEIQRARGGGF